MHPHDLHDWAELLRLTRLQRLLHRKTRRHLAGIGLGLSIMLTGSHMALHPWDGMAHVLWDALAYGLHGFGSIPILKHAEPLWAIFAVKGGGT